MKFKLTNTYSLCITISFELTDVSCHTTNLSGGEDCGDNYALAGDILSKCH